VFVVPKKMLPGTRRLAFFGPRQTGVSEARSKRRWASTANANCVMNVQGATGLASARGKQPRHQTPCFTMMNRGRGSGGRRGRGFAQSERSPNSDSTEAYARDRLQGRALSGDKISVGQGRPTDPSSIPDCAASRLMTIAASTSPARAGSFFFGRHCRPDVVRPLEGRDKAPAGGPTDHNGGLLTPSSRGVLKPTWDSAKRCSPSRFMAGHGLHSRLSMA